MLSFSPRSLKSIKILKGEVLSRTRSMSAAAALKTSQVLQHSSKISKIHIFKS